MRPKITIYSILIFNFSMTYCQKNAFVKMEESEFLALQQKTRKYFAVNNDSAFYYANRIQLSDNKIHQAFAYGAKSYLYAIENKLALASKYYITAKRLLNQAKASKLKTQNASYIYNYGGVIDYFNKDYANALDKFILAKKLSFEINDIVQLNKIATNIANIKSDIGNFSEAISTYKESERLVEINKLHYTQSEYLENKSRINQNIGIAFENYFVKDRTNLKLLDSAFYYFNKALIYCVDDLNKRQNILNSIGNIYYYKGSLEEAYKHYLSCYNLAIQTKNIKLVYNSSFNLGMTLFDKKKYTESLAYFKKVDSVYTLTPSLGFSEYLDSNYRQAKIYEMLGQPIKAYKHSEIYIDHFELNNQIQNQNILLANLKLNKLKERDQMIAIQKEHYLSWLLDKLIYVLLFVLSLGIIVLIFKRKIDKKNLESKINEIISQYKQEVSEPTLILSERENKKSQSIVISSENEEDILNKLKDLEQKQEYLRVDFNQQYVAKKIKSNTSYLSFVVNKHYGKSFSNYYNEKRINYAINQIVNNSKFREYTTQAIAESVGFKNADSFATSFKKKTGVTPFQFITEVKKVS